MLPLLAILLITQQGAFFTQNAGGDRTVDHVKVSAWLVMSAVILLALVTGGGWIYPKRVRDLANDEATQVNRLKALRTGFIAAMLACLALYFITFVEEVQVREAIHIVTTVGLTAALLSFAFMERRAARDG
jgi:uncharacterized iron-regulated membrane protein